MTTMMDLRYARGGSGWIDPNPFPQARDGASLTMAGLSYNVIPPPMPAELVGVKYPLYSSNGELLEQKRTGRQMGAIDPYRDDNWKDWTSGIQYYTPYRGRNIKQMIPPRIEPRIYGPETWGADSLPPVAGLNDYRVQDLTELDPIYTCGDCEIPSASLGVVLPRQPLVPGAVLPVNPIGLYPNIGQYTGREIGWNYGDWPPPVNAIVELAKRRDGLELPATPIMPDYDQQTLEWVRKGFVIS